jgi:hypothetical protein
LPNHCRLSALLKAAAGTWGSGALTFVVRQNEVVSPQRLPTPGLVRQAVWVCRRRCGLRMLLRFCQNGFYLAPLKPDREVRQRRQDSPVPLAAFARCQSCEPGTWRRGAMRNRSEPGQVAQESFELERIAVTLWVCGCYCASARANDSGGHRKAVSQTKDAERRDKVSVRTGKDTRAGQAP